MVTVRLPVVQPLLPASGTGSFLGPMAVICGVVTVLFTLIASLDLEGVLDHICCWGRFATMMTVRLRDLAAHLGSGLPPGADAVLLPV